MNRPDAYAKYGYLSKDETERTLNKYSSLIQWKKCPRILDLGIGDGGTTLEILEPRLPRDYVKLVGTDIQESMISYAKQRCNSNKIDFVLFDAEGEKLLDEKFDHIFSFFVFQYVKDLRKAYSNVYELLNPGGDFLITSISYVPSYTIWEKLLTYPAWSAHKVVVPVLQNLPNCRIKMQYTKALLEELKFTNVEVNIEHTTLTYKNWDACAEFILSVDQIFPKLNEQERIVYASNFYEEMRKVYGPDLENSDGRVVIPYELIITYGFKPLDEKL